MKFKIQIYDIWEYGQRKDAEGNPHQEDSLFPASGKATDADRLFILCDGMGGHDAGEVASATVCETMSQSVLAAQPDAEGDFTQADFDNALSAAYDALDVRDSGATKKMGTTMTFLKLYNQGACIAHMGDSRVYQIRPGKTEKETQIVFRTEDHSLVNDLVRLGELTEEEARTSRQKNVITRAMQPNQERRLKADVKWLTDIQAGDYFYLCSDGMLEEMTDCQICYHFSEAGGNDTTKVVNLIRATEENRDNHTAIIVHILDVNMAGTIVPPVDSAANTKGHYHYTIENYSVEQAPKKKFKVVEKKNENIPQTHNVAQTKTKKFIKPLYLWLIALIIGLCAITIPRFLNKDDAETKPPKSEKSEKSEEPQKPNIPPQQHSDPTSDKSSPKKKPKRVANNSRKLFTNRNNNYNDRTIELRSQPPTGEAGGENDIEKDNGKENNYKGGIENNDENQAPKRESDDVLREFFD